MKDYIDVKNARAIFIKYLGATNHRGSRIKFQDNYRSGETKTVSYSYLFGDVLEQSLQHLKHSGFFGLQINAPNSINASTKSECLKVLNKFFLFTSINFS